MVPLDGGTRQSRDRPQLAAGPRLDGREPRRAADPWGHVLLPAGQSFRHARCRRPGDAHRLARRLRRATRAERPDARRDCSRGSRGGASTSEGSCGVPTRGCSASTKEEASDLADIVNERRRRARSSTTRVRRGGSPPPEAGRAPAPRPARRRPRLRRRHRPLPRPPRRRRHVGDPQADELDPRYGAATAVARHPGRGPRPGGRRPRRTFRERWNDPTPLDRPRIRLGGSRARATDEAAERPDPLPPFERRDPPPSGSHAVQVLRTYPAKRPPYPFAPDGRAKHRPHVPKALAPGSVAHLRRRSVLLVRGDRVAVRGGARDARPISASSWSCRGYPDRNGMVSGPTQPARAAGPSMDRSREAGGDRVAIYDLENERRRRRSTSTRRPCVIDDVWLMSAPTT